MLIYLIYLITPTLGLIRNYTKYKQIKYLLYFRTIIIYLGLQILLQTTNVWKILILERWLLLFVKTLISIYKNDYQNKKIKYIKKYNLKYN